jgi:hypothetical protein
MHRQRGSYLGYVPWKMYTVVSTRLHISFLDLHPSPPAVALPVFMAPILVLYIIYEIHIYIYIIYFLLVLEFELRT